MIFSFPVVSRSLAQGPTPHGLCCAGVAAKLMSAVWTVEEVDGRLLGRIDCHLKEPLTAEEMADLREEIIGQCSDGLGEGFEQRPISTDDAVAFLLVAILPGQSQHNRRCSTPVWSFLAFCSLLTVGGKNISVLKSVRPPTN